MSGIRVFFRLILLSMALLIHSDVVAVATAHPTSSNALLLSPHIHPGQSFPWVGRFSNRAVFSTKRGPVEHFTHTAIYTCNILRGSGNAFIVSRQLKAFVPPHRPILVNNPSKFVGIVMPAQSSLKIWPPIIIRHGRGFRIDGPPLRYDPICKFYSIDEYGNPPVTLKVGTSWPFDRTTDFGPVMHVRGTTTVTSLSAPTGGLAMRIVMTLLDEKRNRYQKDIVVTDGGVIQSEIDRDYFPMVSATSIVNEIPNYVAVWSLKHP